MITKLIITVVIAWLIAQLAKGFLLALKMKRFRFRYFWINGHMPSSHSSSVMALTTGIFLEQRTSALFVLSAVLSMIIMRDACGVRLKVRENMFKLNKNVKKDDDVVGHTFKEVVVGALLGILITVLVYYF